MSGDRVNPCFEAAVHRVACLGRVDAAPGVAVAYLRPLAESDLSPDVALRRIGMVPDAFTDWETVILEYADVWSEMNCPEMTAPPAGALPAAPGCRGTHPIGATPFNMGENVK